jgi:GNAT superfamily N-acetyltransferase
LILPAGAPTEIKRMWVAPAVRGLGLGRRLLAELERWARESGATAARLDTNRNLAEAISMYRSSGYAEIPRFNDERYAHHWFEKPL